MFNFKLTPGALCLVEEDEAECVKVATSEPGTLSEVPPSGL